MCIRDRYHSVGFDPASLYRPINVNELLLVECNLGNQIHRRIQTNTAMIPKAKNDVRQVPKLINIAVMGAPRAVAMVPMPVSLPMYLPRVCGDTRSATTAALLGNIIADPNPVNRRNVNIIS